MLRGVWSNGCRASEGKCDKLLQMTKGDEVGVGRRVGEWF